MNTYRILRYQHSVVKSTTRAFLLARVLQLLIQQMCCSVILLKNNKKNLNNFTTGNVLSPVSVLKQPTQILVLFSFSDCWVWGFFREEVGIQTIRNFSNKNVDGIG